VRQKIHGAMVTTHPEIPEVWDASFVAELDSDLKVSRMLAEARRALSTAGCGHLKIWVSHPAQRAELCRELERLSLSPRPMCLLVAPTDALPLRRHVYGPKGLEIFEVSSPSLRAKLVRARDESRQDAPWYSPEVASCLDRWEDIQAEQLPLRWFVALLEGHPAAGVGLLSHRQGASLQSLSCALSLRHQGIGSRLVQEVMLRAADEGHPELSLLTDSGSKAQALYRRLGFVDLGEVVAYQRGA